MKRKQTKAIVVHHSASSRDKTTASQIRSWHKEKWLTDQDGNSGYHYIITGDGHIHIERPVDEVGANVALFNHKSVGICLTGDFRKEEPSRDQINALKELLAKLIKKYNLKYWNVYGHKDIKVFFVFNSTLTDCPGKNLYTKLPAIRKWLAEVLK